VHSLRALLEIGVDMTRFQVHKETPEATNRWQKTWSLLIKDIKNENKVFEFFWSKGDLAQRLWKEKEKETLEDRRKKTAELERIHKRIMWILKAPDPKCPPQHRRRRAHPSYRHTWSTPGDLEIELQKDLRAKKVELQRVKESRAAAGAAGQESRETTTEDAYWEVQRAARDLEQVQSEIAEAKEFEKKRLGLKSEMAMTKSFGFDSTHLELVYRSLLGEKMNYRMGDLGPHLDLFLLCVLMNQRDLAFELWQQCEVPVCVAICAVRLLLYLPPQRARA
jgi:hypothetical protein